MKKLTLFVGQFVVAAGMVAFVASAQTAVTGMGVSGAGSTGGSSGSGYAVPTSAIAPPVPIDSGFIQFNNLTFQSASASNPPAEILASNPNIYPPIPMMQNQTNVATPPSAPTVVNGSSATCFRFDSQNTTNGNTIPCPAPKAVSGTTSNAINPNPTTVTNGGPSNTMMYPIRYQPYKIEVDGSTHLLLRDRTTATLSDFTAGDQINVYGYYNTNGSIQAYLIRDISKPVTSEFIQLNNVELAAINNTANPATLVVVQQSGYPCYGFGATGASKQMIACPMGIQTPAANSPISNVQVPSALAPNWMMLSKHVITIDANTIILDNNRTKLQLSDLQIGDSLNIYGNTSDNGQTLNADIIRDVSIPPAVTGVNGKVTQVNTDGSFVVQSSDGRTITVQNPIQVGATVQLTGLLDRLKNVLSQVSNITIGNNIMMMTPGMLHTQGNGALPPVPGGTPSNQN